MSLLRRSSQPAPPAADPAAIELRARLRSLHDHCLTNLVSGLDAMTKGDLTYHVAPATKPITTRSENAETQELVDLFNSMLAKAQTALEGYNTVRETAARRARRPILPRRASGSSHEPLRPLPHRPRRGPVGDGRR